MFFSIDPHNGVAIYEQIVRQVTFAIAEGTLRPGQLLPSVRVLSQQLAINPNTINRAFQQLQAEGAIESLRGKGLVVRPDAEAGCKAARRTLIIDRLRVAMTEALHAGLSGGEVRQIMDQLLSELDGNVATIASPAGNPSS